ncbi:hypothetical protein IEO21_06602 [Rhodonia placenta]|uniref:Aminoglycoside phosphotransferase domain-containing protein n=1 Tax=Rhodonia placenta TaxID=104341 RepID=A0A8H7NZQ6_9APHY|nr:hypothetical protein IEO21_06602 [Postia placenta]
MTPIETNIDCFLKRPTRASYTLVSTTTLSHSAKHSMRSFSFSVGLGGLRPFSWFRQTVAQPEPDSKSELWWEESLTDQEIIELCHKAPKLRIPGSSQPGLQPPPIFIISPRVIVKTGWYTLGEFESRAMEIVRAQTSIPVPKPLRIFKRGDTFFLAMEYIKGRSLDWCWDDLSLWRKFIIAWTLRGYIRQLRRVRTVQIERQVPGPLTDDLSKPLKCFGPAMGAEYHCGPFSSAAALFEWLNGRLRVSQYILDGGFDIPPFVQREPLVLVHGDLTPRNVVLGDDGKLWMIDWGSSGVYPPWFEAGGMLFADPQPSWWLWVRRLVAGWYARDMHTYVGALYGMTTGFFVPDPLVHMY